MTRMPIVLLACLAACGGSQAVPPQTTPPVATTPTGTSSSPAAKPSGDDAELALWPEVHTGVLPNGLTYFILKHGKPEKRALMWLAVNAGSLLEDNDQRGLAHFDEHMAFNGTKHFPKADIINYLERIGMKFGADLNAYTDSDETVYQLEVPTDGDAFVGKGLDILREWAGDVSYDPVEVDKERGVVLEEWRLGRGAGQRLFDKQAPVLFKGSRYAERLPIGLPEIIKGAPRDTLHRFYQDWYRPELMAVVVVGDVDPAQIQAEITKRFGDLKSTTKPRPRIHGQVPVADGTRVSIETDREASSQTVEVYNLLAHRSEASAHDYRRLVEEQLYDLMLDERLGILARRPDAPFVGAIAAATQVNRELDGFVRRAVAKPGHVDDALRALFTEVVRVEKFGFTQTELDRARAIIQRNYEQMEADDSTSDSRDYTAEILRYYLQRELMIGRTAEKDLALKYLPSFSLAELNQLATSFGGADNRVILISGPDGKPLPAKDKVLAIVDEVAKAKLEAWDDKATATALIATPPAAGKIVSEKTIDSIGVTEWKLSNGARVVVKPTDFAADEILLTGSAPGGLSEASDKDFNDARFASSLAVNGVGALDVESLEKVLAGKTVTSNVAIDGNSAAVRGSASARDLESLMQLTYLRITAPRKDDQAWNVWQTNEAQQLDDELRNPEHKFQIDMTDALYKHNARVATPTAGNVAAAKQDKALAFYKQRFANAGSFTFVIVGSVDLAKLKPLVETYLASLPSTGGKERDKDLGIRKVGGNVIKTWHAGQAPKATVRMMFHGDEAWTRDKDRDLFVLGQVLSIRLRETLREDMGGVYGVGAFGSIARSPHQERNFTIAFGCAPENVDKLIAAAFAEIKAIADHGIGDDYLEKVKQTFLRGRETSLRDNNTWLGWLANSYRYGDDPTIILDPSKMIARMTSANVQAAAKHYLDNKQYFQAVLLPDATTAPAPATPAP